MLLIAHCWPAIHVGGVLGSYKQEEAAPWAQQAKIYSTAQWLAYNIWCALQLLLL